ncbi:hypothetical protein MAR_033379 [Mya arenaria]|uniref:Uncharacterized protein n=1 Tax=Mya arenaria TaxID=6604 RepID=A0ABY7GBW5_MYAAR|nr:hypothetical protein MAR_033379 [Mya arenaria]
MSQQQVKPVLKASQNFHNAEVRALFQKEVNDVFHLGELIQLTSEEETNIGQEQPTIQREAEDAVLARVADVENKIAALQNEVISLRAENEELKRAQKRNAEEGETSSEVKRLKQE